MPSVFLLFSRLQGLNQTEGELENGVPASGFAALLDGQAQQTAALRAIVEQLKQMQASTATVSASSGLIEQRNVEASPVAAAELLYVQQHIEPRAVLDAKPLCAAEAKVNYVDAIAEAGCVSSFAVQETTWKERMASFTEFQQWFEPTMDALEVDRKVLDATPDDIVAYHVSHWTQKHGETVLEGRLYPAPSSLAGNLSMLSAIFAKNGRVGEYHQILRQGNPLESNVVRSYKQGYAQKLRALGYAATSATHLGEVKYKLLMQKITEKQLQRQVNLDWADKKAVVRFLIVERDLLAFCGAWECLLRGKDMGKLTFIDVQDANGMALVPQLLRHFWLKVPAGFAFQIAPQGTKTIRDRRAGVVRLQAKPEEEAHLCFLRRLQRFCCCLVRAQLSPSNFLFRPETANHQDFKDLALSSSVLNKRLRFYLEELGVFSNETLHGIRRGGMQAEDAKGASLAEVGAKALQRTPAVTAMYLDTSRETNGPVRMKNARRMEGVRFKPY